MKTIAQQLNIKEFPFEIKDSKGNIIYFEDSTGYWEKSKYDSNRNRIYFENSDGYWVKREYNSDGDVMYVEDSTGYWAKSEFDSNGSQIYFENSNGVIRDNKPKKVELTMDEIASKLNIDVKLLKIKK